MSDLPNRKPTRLKNYDNSSPGAYFITICTEGRKKILSEISVVARFVSAFKRFCNKEYGNTVLMNIIRNSAEYEKIWDYIEHNAVKWEDDCFFC